MVHHRAARQGRERPAERTSALRRTLVPVQSFAAFGTLFGSATAFFSRNARSAF
ncbi:hypothetical protein [Streptomyces sp. NPDC058307]|uniref:hypothetical protein n=1 Tax=Streptomyces sp. NPDC058307 TaxID=3346439 RepID=UPI0036E7A70B